MNESTESESAVPAWAIRLEAKVDVALARQGDRLNRHGEVIDDHEARLRAQEGKPTVSPTGLFAAIAGTVGILGALSPFIDRFYS